MAQGEDFVKLTLSNTGIKMNDESGQVVFDRGALKDLHTDIQALIKAMQSATNTSSVLRGGSHVDPSSGLAKQDVYVKKEDLINALSALKAKDIQINSRRTYTDSVGDSFNATYLDNLSASDYTLLKGKKKFVGADAQREAMYLAKLNNVSMRKTRGDWFEYSMAVPTSSVADMTDRQADAYRNKQFNSIFHTAIGYSRSAVAQKNIAQKEKEEKEAQKQKEKEEKLKLESRSKALRFLAKLVATTVAVTELVRKILVGITNNFREKLTYAQDTVTYGIGMTKRRDMDYLDQALGNPKGTYMRAVGAIQDKFGDITNLDEKSLGVLARVMGGEVNDLVRSGIGGETPDKLLERILDKYFAQYKSGKNSLGMQVGQADAGRELVQSLKSVSPELSTLFATMLRESALGKNFSSFSELQKSLTTGIITIPSNRLVHEAQVADQSNAVMADFKSALDSFASKFTIAIADLTDTIKSWKLGQDTVQRRETGIEAGKQNEINATKAWNMLGQSATSAYKNRVKIDGFAYDAFIIGLLEAGVSVEDIKKYNSAYDADFLKKNYGLTSKNVSSYKNGINRARTALLQKGMDTFSESFVVTEIINKLNKFKKESEKAIDDQTSVFFSVEDLELRALANEKKFITDLARLKGVDNRTYASLTGTTGVSPSYSTMTASGRELMGMLVFNDLMANKGSLSSIGVHSSLIDKTRNQLNTDNATQNAIKKYRDEYIKAGYASNTANEMATYRAWSESSVLINALLKSKASVSTEGLQYMADNASRLISTGADAVLRRFTADFANDPSLSKANSVKIESDSSKGGTQVNIHLYNVKGEEIGSLSQFYEAEMGSATIKGKVDKGRIQLVNNSVGN